MSVPGARRLAPRRQREASVAAGGRAAAPGRVKVVVGSPGAAGGRTPVSSGVPEDTGERKSAEQRLKAGRSN